MDRARGDRGRRERPGTWFRRWRSQTSCGLRAPRSVFVGGERAERELVPGAGYELDVLAVEGLSRTNPLRAARAVAKAAAAVVRSVAAAARSSARTR